MNDADAALLGERDRQARFGDRVHGCAYDWYVQFDPIGQSGIGSNFGGQHVRFERNNQDVVEGVRVA